MLAKKKGVSESSPRRRRAYELEGMVPLAFPQDPIREIENEVLRDLSEEYRVLRLEQMIEKRKREVVRMRDGGVDGPLPSNTDFLNMAKALSELSPEEAQRVRSSYTFFKLAEKGGGGSAGMNLLLPLIGYARQNPGSSENQMINYLKLMDGQLVKGLELAKAMGPAKGSDAMEFLKIMKDLVISGVRDPLMQAFKENQPQLGVLEQILLRPELFSRAKEIGMFGGSGGASTNIDLEIEKLRGDRQLQTTKWELEMRREDLKRQAEDRRTDTILSIFGPLAAGFASSASQRMENLGQQQATAHNPFSVNPVSRREVAPPERTIQMKCPCGYEAEIPLTDPAPEKFECPNCDQVLMYNQNETLNGGKK